MLVYLFVIIFQDFVVVLRLFVVYPRSCAQQACLSIHPSLKLSKRPDVSPAFSKCNMVTEHNLTGVEHSSEHPALGETHRHSSVSVVQQDLDAARPSCRRHAHGVVVTPVSNQHAIIILRVHLREERGQRSVSLPVKRSLHLRFVILPCPVRLSLFGSLLHYQTSTLTLNIKCMKRSLLLS